MAINSITFDPSPGPGTEVTFDEFHVYMGYCANDELSATYDANYVNGWKYKVFERTSSVTFHASDPTIYFDTPFFYVPANGNLIMDIAWPDGEDEFYTYSSGTTGLTCVHGAYGSPSGDQYMETSHLFINGEMTLNQMTFAGIKASFR
ncbi:MAG: hypothetical protein K8S62_08245 [Candidatus Sabulitectum sp.]|nr:hypothetical protein [Candidatus Sabulitectum sp.]